MLLPGPATGYALKKRIEASVGHFWHESFGQLYPALAALESRGLVTASGAGAARDAREWTITQAGREALAAWLEGDVRPQKERNELLVKLFFAEVAPTAARRHVARAGREAARELAALRALREEVAARTAGHPSAAAWLATLDYGIAGNEALVTWAEATSRAIAGMRPKSPSARRSREARSR
jgi:DNA-binding PadR family transcriptional regulator